ncbi:MAG: hypothetical protein ACRYG8_10320 [Janthinobacterium lividum]
MTDRLDTARAASVVAAARFVDAHRHERAEAHADAKAADTEVARLEGQDFDTVVRRARSVRDAAEQAESRGLQAFLALQEGRREAQADLDEVLATAEIWSAPLVPAVSGDAGVEQEPARARAAPRFGFPGPGPLTIPRIRVVSRNP